MISLYFVFQKKDIFILMYIKLNKFDVKTYPTYNQNPFAKPRKRITKSYIYNLMAHILLQEISQHYDFLNEI